ncbi:MAG: NAD(P)-dependent oxidoreductase, partial [Nitrospinota bacterium]|nr:NAD(P)-dependent oxidoreductase [Nitrospinota bacterium]
MNVLVTGGGGFLGSHLACRLHEMGHRVSILGRRRYSNLPEAIIQHQADLRDSRAVSEACREQNSVFHAGALPGVWGAKKDFYQTNVYGTRHVIEGCLEHG